MKRILALVLTLVIVAGLTACSTGTPSTSSAAPNTSSAAPSTSSAAPAASSGAQSQPAAAPEFELTLGEINPASHPQSLTYHWMAARVLEKSGGRIKINVFTDSSLGNANELVEGLGFNTVQITKNMTTTLTGMVPELSIFDLPYLMQSYDHFKSVFTDEKIVSHYAELLSEFDLVPMAWFYGGARSFYSKKPITQLSDMAGWVIRVPESNIYLGMCSAFGASGTPIALGDIYTALQTGVVDGAENAPMIWETFKHYEVAPYLTLDEHIMTPDVVLMSKSYLESLPEDVRSLLVEALYEMQDYEGELWLSMEDEIIESLLSHGAIINEIDKAPFREAARAVWGQYTDIVGQEWIDAIQALA